MGDIRFTNEPFASSSQANKIVNKITFNLLLHSFRHFVISDIIKTTMSDNNKSKQLSQKKPKKAAAVRRRSMTPKRTEGGCKVLLPNSAETHEDEETALL